MSPRPIDAGCLIAVVAFFVAFGLAVLVVAVALPGLRGERPADRPPATVVRP